MKKTLIICGTYPLPENIGTNMRTMNFVRFFRKIGTVDIAYSKTIPGEQKDNLIFSNKIFLKIEGNINDLPNWPSKALKMRRMPWPIIKFSGKSEKLLLSTIKDKDYDYILVRYVTNTKSFFQLSEKFRMRTIIDLDDLFSAPLYNTLSDYHNKNLGGKVYLSLNWRFLKKYENSCLNFGASLFCSFNEIKKLDRKLKRRSVFVVPNVYNINGFKTYSFGDGINNENNLLFVGILNYEPNIIGLKWFIESIFPEFKERYHKSKLIIIGRFPTDDVKEICKDKNGVELIGDVPDVREYYKACRAVVVPILAGGGTRIKILEAALAKRPILSTPIGAEGLGLEDETDLLLFKNAKDFLSKYQILYDQNKYNSLIHNAKNVVINKFSINSFNDTMINVLNEIERQTNEEIF